jgi:hypothetical protein
MSSVPSLGLSQSCQRNRGMVTPRVEVFFLAKSVLQDHRAFGTERIMLNFDAPVNPRPHISALELEPETLGVAGA